MKKLSFFESLGFGRSKKKKVQRASSIYFGDLGKIGGLQKKKADKQYPYTRREKKISLATVGGAGAGFVIGGLTGGVLGMLAGVPIGTFAGNTYARTQFKQRGRKSYYHPSYFKQLTSTREDLFKEKEEIYRIERARVKSERTRPVKLFAKRHR